MARQPNAAPLGYLFAVGISLLTLTVQLLLKGALSSAVFILFYPAAFLTAALFGWGPAIVVIGAGIVCAHAIFLPGSLAGGPHWDGIFRSALFAVMATLMSGLVSKWNRRQQRVSGELDAERRRLNAIVDQMPVGIVIVEAASGKVVLGNRHVEETLARPAIRLNGRPFREIVYQLGFDRDSRPYAPEKWPVMRSLATGGRVTNEEIAVLRDDGHCRMISVSSAPITDCDGEVMAAVMAFIDISEQKRIEHELRESEERFRVVRELSPDGFSIFKVIRDAAGGVVDFRWSYMNFATARMLGVAPNELVGRRLRDVLPHDPSSPFFDLYRQVADTGEARALEAPYAGGPFQDTTWFRVVVVRISGGDIAVLAEDITARKQAEQRLEHAIQQRDDLMAILSHDLKNPLTSIDMTATLLMKAASGELKSEAVIERSKRIKQSVVRALHLISDLLDVSRIDAGRLEVRRRDCDTSSLVQAVIDELRPLAQEKGTTLSGAGPTREIRFAGDPERLAQVLSNLVGNAIKFAPSQEGRIVVAVEASDEEVVFCVADNGPGIGDEELPHVFDRFWHAKRSNKAGAGLGLSIAKGIVEAHQGKIWVESRTGAGAKFFFALPRERSWDERSKAG